LGKTSAEEDPDAEAGEPIATFVIRGRGDEF
jgi:hypothetical protein